MFESCFDFSPNNGIINQIYSEQNGNGTDGHDDNFICAPYVIWLLWFIHDEKIEIPLNRFEAVLKKYSSE